MELYFFLKLILLIFIGSCLLITMLMMGPFKQKKLVNGFTIVLFSGVSLLVSTITGIIGGYLADGLYSGGDPYIMYLFILLFLIIVMNLMIYVASTRRNSYAKNGRF
jgi:cytochrome c biogenesis factor